MGPEDFELGTKPIRVLRRKRCGVVISARFTSEDADRLDDLAEQRGVGYSHLVRQIVREYLAKLPAISLRADFIQREVTTTGNAVNIHWN